MIVRAAESGPIIDAANRFANLDTDQLISIILTIASWFLILVGLIGVIMVLWSAFQFVTAGAGKEEQITKAKKTLTYSLIGVVIAILAFSVVTFTNSLLEGGSSSSPPPTSEPPIFCTPGSCPGDMACIDGVCQFP